MSDTSPEAEDEDEVDTEQNTTSESTSDTTDTTTDTTGMEEAYYGNCPNGVIDCEPSELCKVDADINDAWQVCALPCADFGECPEANGLPLTCISYYFQEKVCHIDCADTPCPDGMACKAVNGGFDHICAYRGLGVSL